MRPVDKSCCYPLGLIKPCAEYFQVWIECCNRMLNPEVKVCLELIWSPTFPLHLFSPLCVSCWTRSSIHHLSLAFCLFCSSFFFSYGNELREAGHIDRLNPANEGLDPQAAPLACSTLGVNGSNFSLINHTNSNWLLISVHGGFRQFPFLSLLSSACLWVIHLKSAVLLICYWHWHYVTVLAANEKWM